MKKILAMVLALVMCLSLCACGSASKEDVVGTYAYASGIYDDAHVGDTLSLHDDFTYDWDHEQGTYKISGNKIVLTSKDDDTTRLVTQGDICYFERFTPLENDYGQTVAFSKEGRINLTLHWQYGYNANYYHLTLCDDGSFTLWNDWKEIEGTYALENNILTLTGEDVTYYLVCTKDGITKDVFKKQTSETVKGGDIVEGPVEAPAE